MGFLDWFLGRERRKPAQVVFDMTGDLTGCWWDHPEVIPLAAASDFTVDVVGEAQWQNNISRVVGGKCWEGHNAEVVAQLVFEDNPRDPNAVGVLIDAQPIGWIPAADAPQYRKELTRLNPQRRALTCRAKIVGGWDRGEGDEGHFGVKLSLVFPLQVDPSRV